MFSKVKKILAAILCLVCLCSCGVKRAENNGKIKVVTTVFPLYDFVRAVGGDRVDITLLRYKGDIRLRSVFVYRRRVGGVGKYPFGRFRC